MHMVRHYFNSKDFPLLLFRNGIQDALQLILVAVKNASTILRYPNYVQV